MPKLDYFLVSAILLEQLKKKGFEASYYAGHSLGELTACYAAGVYSLETAIDLVIARGRFMSAYSDGAMAAILGTDLSNLESELVEFESESVVVANYNFSGQYVISGSKEGVQKACDKLQDLSNVKRVVLLKVGGPFHSPFMKKASEQFKDFVAPLTFNNAQVPIILNRTALTETQGAAIKENLPLQICSAVRWYQSIEKIAPSTTTFIECGSGKVLTGLIKKILKGVSVQSVSDCETLDALDLVLKGA